MNRLPRLGARPVIALAAVLVAGLAACSSDRQAVSAPPFGTGETATSDASDSPSTNPAIPVDRVAMIGDSITAGAQPVLEEEFAALDLDEVLIDAVSGRRMLVDGSIDSGLDAVEAIAAADAPDLWVIALGTNDVGNYTPDQYGAAVDELLAAIPADAPVVWVDIYVEELSEESAAFNDVLRMTLFARGESSVVDWASIAQEEGMLYDGVHPSEEGIERFSDSVVAAVEAWVA